MRNVLDLTDDELEDCFNGSTSPDLVREIFDKPGVLTNEGFVELEQFAEWFAYAIEGYIDADEGTAEYDEAWDNNFNWGMDIADSINEYLNEDE